MLEINNVKLYDTEELAALLNVSKPTISKLRNKGKLKFTRIGKKLYTSEQALNDYLNGVVAEQTK